MNLLIAYLIAVGIGLIVGVVMVEISEGREQDRRRADDYAEFDEWRRARDITGRVSR